MILEFCRRGLVYVFLYHIRILLIEFVPVLKTYFVDLFRNIFMLTQVHCFNLILSMLLVLQGTLHFIDLSCFNWMEKTVHLRQVDFNYQEYLFMGSHYIVVHQPQSRALVHLTFCFVCNFQIHFQLIYHFLLNFLISSLLPRELRCSYLWYFFSFLTPFFLFRVQDLAC